MQNRVRVKMWKLNDDMRLNIEFVKEVERHPCLYNVNLREYNNKTSLDKAWKEIGQRFCGINGPELRTKWKSVRSSFTRSFRTKKEYYLTEYLDFLLPFTKTRHVDDSTVKNESEESDDNSGSQSSDDCLSEVDQVKNEQELENDDDFKEQNGKIQVRTLPELKFGQSNGKIDKTKRTQSKILSQYTKSQLSAHECYLKSLLPDVSSMNERQYFNFRRGMLNIVGKIRYGGKGAAETES